MRKIVTILAVVMVAGALLLPLGTFPAILESPALAASNHGGDKFGGSGGGGQNPYECTDFQKRDPITGKCKDDPLTYPNNNADGPITWESITGWGIESPLLEGYQDFKCANLDKLEAGCNVILATDCHLYAKGITEAGCGALANYVCGKLVKARKPIAKPGTVAPTVVLAAPTAVLMMGLR